MKSTNGKATTRAAAPETLGMTPEVHGHIDATAAEAIRMVGRNKRVLELGCGAGHLSRALGAQGCTVVGIEVQPDAAKAARAACERVIVGDLDSLDFNHQLGDDRFDVVLASDVLAHLRDPLSVLAAVKKLLAPDGYLVASVPNVAHISIRLALLGGRFPYGETGLLDRMRLRFLTRESIEKLMDDADLAIGAFERITKRPEDPARFEVPFDPAVVPSALLEGMSRDPEALTYEFVLSAYPLPSASLMFVRDRMKQLSHEARSARSESAQLRVSLREAEERIEQGRRELTEARREIATLESISERSALAASEKALLVDERNWLKGEIGRVQEAWMQSERALGLTQDEARTVSEHLETVSAERTELAEQVLALTEECRSLQAEIGCLQETFTHSERTLESTQAEVQERESRTDEQYRWIAGLEAQIKTLLAREHDLRDMLLDAHDQLLRRDEDIAMTLASTLQRPAAAVVSAAPANPPAAAAQTPATPAQPAAASAAKPSAPPQVAPAGGKYLQYQNLILRIRESVRKHLPEGGHVLVVSKGDVDLLRLDPCRGAHFPQREDGVYAGYYPADSRSAIAHIQELQKRGAQYFLIPQTAVWWMDHYRELADYLREKTTTLFDDRETCLLFQLTPAAGKPVRRHDTVIDTPKAETLPFGVNISGYLTSEKGVGEAVRGQARSLLASGVPVVLNNLVDDTAVNEVDECTSFSADNPYGVNLIHLNADALLDFVGTREQEYFRNRYNIGFWAWETSRFPSAWWDRFEHLDEIWVGSDFVLDAISRVSPIPVVKTPLAAPIRPSIGVPSRARLNLGKKTCVFLFIFDYMSIFQRKNPLAAVQAFRKAFSSRDDVMLVLKCSHSHANPDEARQLEKACQGANIRIIDNVIPRQDVNALMNAADCYVSLHRSEGFGLTMAETMSLGKPVIATGYSGNMEFMTPANSLLVKYRLAEIDQAYGPYQGGEWADPDVNHAAELMRFVFKNRDEAKAIGKRARADMLRAFSPIAVGARMRDRLLRIADTGRIAGPLEPRESPIVATKKSGGSRSRSRSGKGARR